jgi:hypothetical protein
MTKYQEDMLQILNNFVAYCDPYIIISWQEPLTGYEIRSIVRWDGSANPNYESLYETTDYERFECDTTFTIEGYIYKSEEKDVVPICKIDADFVLENAIEGQFLEYDVEEDSDRVERVTVTGVPFIMFSNMAITEQNQRDIMVVSGKDLNDVKGVFLTSTNESLLDFSDFNPFQNTPKETIFPSFRGYPIPTFQPSGSSSVTFKLPEFNEPGVFDVIVLTDCGYGKLTEGVAYLKSLHDPQYPYTIGYQNGVTVFSGEYECDDHLILANITPPVISGTVEIGGYLTVINNGQWTWPPIQITYQWYKDGNPIDGATESNYQITENDNLTHIFCQITALAFGQTIDVFSNSIYMANLVMVDDNAVAQDDDLVVMPL